MTRRLARWLSGVAVAALATGASVGRSQAAPPPAQTMRVDVRGAVAHVTVTRAVVCGGGTQGGGDPGADAPADVIVDLALPERAALLTVELADGKRFQATKPIDITKGRDTYLESLRALGVAGGKRPFDDEVDFRIRVGCRPGNAKSSNTLKYSFSVLLDLSEQRGRIVFPASPDVSPPPTRVDVRVAAGDGVTEVMIAGAAHGVRSGAEGAAFETVSGRGRWLISTAYARGPTQGPERSRLTGLTSAAAAGSGSRTVAYALGALPGPQQPLADRILFVVDRSRSVGAGGLEAERNLARRLLELTPPATRFDALFFDRGPKRLFAVPRAATREAILAFEEEMVPVRMGNGTDLVGALRAAGDLMRREANDFAPRALLVILSDGAIGKPTGGVDLASLVGPIPGVALATAAISIRPNDDPAVSADERRVLRRLAATAPAGGVERAIRAADIADAAPAILAALRAGGDVHTVQLSTKVSTRGRRDDGGAAGPGKRTIDIADAIAAGDATTGIASVPAGALALAHQGQAQPSPLRPSPVDAAWLAPFLRTTLPDARLLVGPSLAVLVEPVFHPSTPTPTDALGPSGYMERSVVRDALSLAFTPRARACYLNRSARTPADRDLTGRVRLALDLVRGEVGGARVESSTLGRPAIENCLRDAAYALEVPRAYRNDDPVTAVLNLVFRPRNPERRGVGAVENPSIASELDLVVEAALKNSAGAPPPAGPATPASAGSGTDGGTPADRDR